MTMATITNLDTMGNNVEEDSEWKRHNFLKKKEQSIPARSSMLPRRSQQGNKTVVTMMLFTMAIAMTTMMDVTHALSITGNKKSSSISTKQVLNKSDIMNVAILRNECRSPQEMIQQQLLKRESFDPVDSAKDGVLVGLFMGCVIGSLTYLSGEAATVGLQNAAITGGTIATLLGINNYSGNRVYVMTEKEAINRLRVDFVASLLAGQDVGFVARLSDREAKGTKYESCDGVVGCLDCQLRGAGATTTDTVRLATNAQGQADIGTLNAKQYGTLLPHVHMKNMLVDDDMRRRGVGTSLLSAVEDYVKKKTNAQLVSLQVESANTGAVALYERAGYVVQSKDAKEKYGSASFMLGRLTMIKEI